MTTCLCTGRRVNFDYERIASCFLMDPGSQDLTDNAATHCSVEHPNRSAVTHPSKTDCHKLYGVTHPVRQRADSGQEIFSTWRSHLALAYRYIIFVWLRRESMLLCTGSRVYFNYVRLAPCVGNHSAMIHPSKANWHYGTMESHSTVQQRADFLFVIIPGTAV